MHSSKLYAVLTTFNEAEWKECKKFISIYGSHRTDTAQLYQYFYTYRKNLKHKNLTATICQDKLFRHLSDKSFRNILSKLHRIIEDYIVWQRVKSDHATYDLQLFEALDDRGVNQQANKIADRVRASVRSSDTIDFYKYYTLHKISHEQYYSDNPIKYQRGKEILYDALINLHHYQRVLTIMYETELASMSVIMNQNWTLHWEQLQSNWPIGTEESILQQLYRLKTEPSEEDYKNLKGQLGDPRLSGPLAQINYSYLNHYLTDKTYHGDRLEERFELMQEGLAKGLFLDKGTISPTRFWNIVNIACVLNRIDWVDEFVDQWKRSLPPQDAGEWEVMSQIRILLAKKYYTKCLRMIALHKMSSAKNDNIIQKLRFICYYDSKENGDFILLELGKYSSFLKKNKNSLSRTSFDHSQKFVECMKHLLTKDYEKIQLLISNYPISNRYWFIKKLEKSDFSS